MKTLFCNKILFFCTLSTKLSLEKKIFVSFFDDQYISIDAEQALDSQIQLKEFLSFPSLTLIVILPILPSIIELFKYLLILELFSRSSNIGLLLIE